MTTRTLTAMFNTRAEAERAGQMLVSDLHVPQAMIRTSPEQGANDSSYDATKPYEEKGFFGALKDLFVPDEDRYAYAEGMRRGAVLLTTTVNETEIGKASDIIEHAGAVDLDAQEASWKEKGWTGYDSVAHGAATPVMAATAASSDMSSRAASTDETIKVVQERLVVGKRAIEGGRVRVRAYVVERPVEENITLHQEHVTVDRRPVDRAATAEDLAMFGEKTIEARATSEEAVVGKEARVVEEIGVHKQASDRTETVHDTVRSTQVEVEDTTTAKTGAATTGTATTGAAAATAARPAGTGLAAAVDRTLDTNLSGTNPKT